MTIKKKVAILILLLIINLAAFVVYDSVKESSEESDVEKKVDFIEVGPYQLGLNQTLYLEELQIELEKSLTSNDGNAIIESVSKYFIADFFTLKNMQNRDDVGGLGLVSPPYRKEFKTNAVTGLFLDWPKLADQYGRDELFEVIDVKIKSIEEAYLEPILNEEAILSGKEKSELSVQYIVTASITYADNDFKDKFVEETTLAIIKYDKNWYIYEVRPIIAQW